jgi:hypothetical protein
MNVQQTALKTWRHFSPKVRYQVLTAAVAYAVLKLGISLDPILEGAIPIALGGVAGYAAPERPRPTSSARATRARTKRQS